ncbi:MAG: hypothetical protein ACJAQU_002852 [Loktanella salsilacus]|jgi:hypothetical protein
MYHNLPPITYAGAGRGLGDGSYSTKPRPVMFKMCGFVSSVQHDFVSLRR